MFPDVDVIEDALMSRPSSPGPPAPLPVLPVMLMVPVLDVNCALSSVMPTREAALIPPVSTLKAPVKFANQTFVTVIPSGASKPSVNVTVVLPKLVVTVTEEIPAAGAWNTAVTPFLTRTLPALWEIVAVSLLPTVIERTVPVWLAVTAWARAGAMKARRASAKRAMRDTAGPRVPLDEPCSPSEGHGVLSFVSGSSKGLLNT